MSIKVLVLDAYDHPVSNATVSFKWYSGQSKVQADSSGIADSGREDTLVSVHAYGKTCLSFGPSGQYFRDVMLKIRI